MEMEKSRPLAGEDTSTRHSYVSERCRKRRFTRRNTTATELPTIPSIEGEYGQKRREWDILWAMKDYRNLDKFIAGLRREYSFGKLEKGDLAKNPLEQFSRWLGDAIRKRVPHLDAMALATATSQGKPSVRIVLLKGFDPRGFVFYTHYDSRKGREIKKNSNAEIVLFWGPFERQVRIAGKLQKLTPAESDRYFATRPRESQIGCWASHQSASIHDRAALESAYKQAEKKFRGKTIPRPPFWGGYRLKPQTFEFWQGRANRLNDRFIYKKGSSGWQISRLQP